MKCSGAIDLLASERGVFCIIALVIATVLVILGQLHGDQWLDFVKYLVGFLVASKTVTTAVEVATTKKPQIERTPDVPRAQVHSDGSPQ